MMSVTHADFDGWGKEKKPVKDSIDVLTQYTIEKPYGFIKAFYVLGIDLPRLLGLLHPDNSVANICKDRLSLLYLTQGPVGVLKGVHKTVKSAWSCWTQQPITHQKGKEERIQPLSQVVRDAASIVSPVTKIFTFFTRAILYIPPASIAALNVVNGGAVAFLMSWSACENFATLAEDRACDLSVEILENNRFQDVQALMHLMQQIAYCALGMLIVTSAAVSSAIFTALSVTGVVFTVLPFYYKNIGQEKNVT